MYICKGFSNAGILLFCIALELRMVFTFCRSCKKRMCKRDPIPNMPKLFPIWTFVEKVCWLQCRWHTETPHLPFPRWESWDPERRKDLPKVTQKMGFSFSCINVYCAVVLGLAGLVKHRNRWSLPVPPKNSQPEKTHRETIITQVDQGSRSPRVG